MWKDTSIPYYSYGMKNAIFYFSYGIEQSRLKRFSSQKIDTTHVKECYRFIVGSLKCLRSMKNMMMKKIDKIKKRRVVSDKPNK